MSQTGELWIGLVELSGSPDNPILQGSVGAFSTYLVLCKDMAEFRNAAERTATDLGLNLCDVQWAQSLRERMRLFELEEYLLEVAEAVQRTGEGSFGRFHTWDPEA
jgi:hypothetical protein